MPITRQFDFEEFFKSIELKFIENGLFCGDDWIYDELKAPYNRLYIILDGEGVVYTSKGQIQLKKGYAYIVPANFSFGCFTPKYLKKIFVHFSIDKLFHTGLFDEINRLLELKIHTEDYLPYYKALEDKNSAFYYNIIGDFTKLIYKFISEFNIDLFESNYLSLSPKLKKLYNLLKINITAKTRTCDLADYLNMSQSMLSKMYKFETGNTLKWFLQQKLIQRAQLLLLTTTKSIQEIAYMLEYDDALYFSRVFKRWIGESPSSYREKNKFL